MSGHTSHVSGCGWLAQHCTVLTCTICPVICWNVVSLTKHSGWIVVFPIHGHSWKQQLGQHQFWMNSSIACVSGVVRIVAVNSFRNWVFTAPSRQDSFIAQVDWRLSDLIQSLHARGIWVVACPLSIRTIVFDKNIWAQGIWTVNCPYSGFVLAT